MGAPGKDNGYMLLIRDELFTCCRTDKDADRVFLDTCGPKGVGSMVVTGKGSECVCVFFPSILDIKFVGRTSRGHTGGRSHRIFNPPSFCGACLDFCREKDSAIPFPRRP